MMSVLRTHMDAWNFGRHILLPYNYAVLFTRLIFHKVIIMRTVTILFHEVDKIATGSSYMSLKSWKIYNLICDIQILLSE